VKETIYRTGVVKGDNVNVRSKPQTSAEVLTRLNRGTKVNVYEGSEGWYKVEYAQGKFGWMYEQYIVVSGSEVSRGAVEDASPSVTAPVKQESVSASTQQQLVAYAKKYLGVKYVYGGSSPKGFDCSGFVKYVYKHFGITLERVAASQAKHGTTVNRDSLKVGDLVFFDTNGGHNNIGHVGIYIGEGKFIHASSGRSAREVIISDLRSGFYSTAYMKARRYIK
jgi:N-acetylmuramoyl-L-alanine amidase